MTRKERINNLKLGDIISFAGDDEDNPRFEIIESVIYNDKTDFRNDDNGKTRVTINGVYWNKDDIVIK